MSLAHSPANDTRREGLFKDLRAIGGSKAKGDDALASAALKIIYAVSDGALTLDKDSDGKDGVHHAYNEYLKGFSTKAVHEHTPDGVKSNESKMRACAKAAAETQKYDFVTVSADTLTIRKDKKAAGEKVYAAFPAIVEVAREQIKRDTDLTAEEIGELVVKPAPAGKELDQEWAAILKKVEGLITGENRHSLKDQTPAAIEIHEKVRAHVATFTLARDTAEVQAKAAALGLVIVEPQIEAELEVAA